MILPSNMVPRSRQPDEPVDESAAKDALVAELIECLEQVRSRTSLHDCLDRYVEATIARAKGEAKP